MSEPTLADVIVRLDRLEAALHQLIDAVRAGAGSARPAAAVVASAPPPAPVPAPPVAHQGVAASGEPPIIQVAPPPPRGGEQAAAAQMSRAPVQTPFTPPPEVSAEPSRPYDPYGWRTDIEVPGPSGTIEQVLRRVFEAGLMAEPEDTWAVMARLTHPSQMQGPRALDHFKAFNWHKLRRTAATYLKSGDPGSFVIAYTDPAEVTPEVDRVRVFIRAGDNRMPVPVGFARDPAQGNAWRVTMMSL